MVENLIAELSRYIQLTAYNRRRNRRLVCLKCSGYFPHNIYDCKIISYEILLRPSGGGNLGGIETLQVLSGKC